MSKPEFYLIETRNRNGRTFREWYLAVGFTNEDIKKNIVDPQYLKTAWLECQDGNEEAWIAWNEARKTPKIFYQGEIKKL